MHPPLKEHVTEESRAATVRALVKLLVLVAQCTPDEVALPLNQRDGIWEPEMTGTPSVQVAVTLVAESIETVSALIPLREA